MKQTEQVLGLAFWLAFLRKQGSAITKLLIGRERFPKVNRYDDKVRSQFLSSEILGKVRAVEGQGAKLRRLLRLHDGKRAVHFAFVD
jgi:hypothetical protein